MKKAVLLSGFLFTISLLTSCTTDDFEGNDKIMNEKLIQINSNSIQENNYDMYGKDGDSIYQNTETNLGDPIVKPKNG
jgi:hypothetical protein